MENRDDPILFSSLLFFAWWVPEILLVVCYFIYIYWKCLCSAARGVNPSAHSRNFIRNVT